MSTINLLPKEDALKLLPLSVINIVETVSYEVAIKLVTEYGGLELCVPKTVKDKHPLTKLLGLKDCQKLVSIYGGETIEIPRCNVIKTQIRNLQIIKDKEQGLLYRELAKKYNLTTRTIRTILSNAY